MKKVLAGVALSSVLFLGSSCSVEETYEYSCRSKCDDARNECYDKAKIPVVDKKICDNDHKKCTDGCK
jgi:hypothetical protein